MKTYHNVQEVNDDEATRRRLEELPESHETMHDGRTPLLFHVRLVPLMQRPQVRAVPVYVRMLRRYMRYSNLFGVHRGLLKHSGLRLD
jgi:hypothetical protein